MTPPQHALKKETPLRVQEERTPKSAALTGLPNDQSALRPVRSIYRAGKRAVDLAVAVVGLAVVLPVMALIAGAIAVTTGRPILFRQERPGLNGEIFTLLKFRTMQSGSSSDSERLTKLGRVLRAASLDELPQLWNVAKGEMTLIGPRPLLPEYLPLYNNRQARRHEVRPGVTGLAQVSGRNAVGWDERLETDVVYVENESLLLDLRIVGSTIIQVAKRSDISPDGDVTMEHFTGSASTATRAR